MLVIRLFDRSLCALRKNSGPFFFLFFFLETFFMFPVGHTIIPKMKVDVKLGRDHTTKAIHVRINLLARDRETEVVRA